MDYPNDSVTNPSPSSTVADVSYVSAYQPPVQSSVQPLVQPLDTFAASTSPVNPSDDATLTPNAWSAPAPLVEPAPIESTPAEPIPTESAPSAEPTSPAGESVAAPAATQSPTPSEELADQNIFEMLGVTDGTPEQREQFLTELQQVIWEDFIDHDVKLLLTESEHAEFQGVMQSAPDKSEEQQEKALEYLEKLIPDLEEIMLEKALQLKEEMVKERVRALRQLHAQDPAKLALLDQADTQMTDQLWRSATRTLASI